MPAWGSRWLEREATPDAHQDNVLEDGRSQQACSSGRQHGARWFNVVQGIRRSLDVHLKSYYKVDNAFASTLRCATASDKLKTLSRGLTDTGLIDFCCFYLVHPARGTFGVVALSGAGAELFPPALTNNNASSNNVFTRCVFQVQHSNWAVEDVVTSKAPWYYDCASAANGFGLPQDGAWLRRAGLRSVLALPCITGNDVYGVLAVASRQKTLDHLLLRKLEELCFKVTPIVTEAVSEHSLLLCSRRAASRYESISDFAHEVLGEMLNLDRAVAGPAKADKVSAAGSQRQTCCKAGAAEAAAACAPRSQQQQQVSSRGRPVGASPRGRREEEAIDTAAAMAAAAAAGFSWTSTATLAPMTPQVATTCTLSGVIPASTSASHTARTPAATAPQPHRQCQAGPDASSSAPVSLDDGLETFCTAVTGMMVGGMGSSDAAFTAVSSSPVEQSSESALGCTPAAAAMPAAQPLAREAVLDETALTQSLPGPTRDGNCQMFSYLLRGGEGCFSVQQHQQLQEVQAGCGAAVSSDRNTVRSNRSLSCLEFSGGFASGEGAAEVESCGRPGSSCGPAGARTGGAVQPGRGGAVTAVAAAAGSPAAALLPACRAAAAAAAATGGGRTTVLIDAADDRTPGQSNRTTESGTGEGCFMLESMTTEELSRLPQENYMISASAKSSDRRTFQRVSPLEPSIGRTALAAAAVASASESSRPSGTGAIAAAVAMGARGSSACATDASALPDWASNTTNATTIPTATSGVSCMTRLSGPGASSIGSRPRGDDAALCGGDTQTLIGRWSRDSAAAAAAVWNNEAAEAFAAAMRFTAAQARGVHRSQHSAVDNSSTAAARGAHGGCSSSWSGPASMSAHRYGGSSATAAAAAATVLGDLYGIRESGTVPSMGLSLDGSVSVSLSGDCGSTVMDLASGAGFILNSGLGAEAAQRHGQALLSQSPQSDRLSVLTETQWMRCGAARS